MPGSWWSRRSLRARLTAAASVVIAAGMLLASALLLWRVHSSLVANLDAAVIQQARTVAVDSGNGALNRTLPNAGDGAATVQVVAADGTILATSANVDNPRQQLFRVSGATDDATVSTAKQAGGDRDDLYRVAVLKANRPAGPVTIYAALPTAGVNESTGELAAALAVGGPLLVLVLAAAGWFLVGRALHPVEAMRRQAASINGTDLGGRLDQPIARDELGRLADTFNELLNRIESAAGRQRQFVADAAHELRSPIASLQAQAEVAARHPDPASSTARAEGIVTDAQRLSHLVDDLLALARLDASPRHHRQVVDLDDLVLGEARRLRDRGPRVDTGHVSAGQVLGDPSALGRVVRNLLDNAVRHAASVVTVRLVADSDAVTFVVADDGSGIPEADVERVFERFTRLDDARSRDAGGAGLGLAIVRDVVESHLGTVRLEDNDPGARFTVTLPAQQ